MTQISRQIMPSWTAINRYQTIIYARKSFRGYISGRIRSSLPDDVLATYFGAKAGGDNTDIRSKMLLKNYFTLQYRWQLGDQFPDIILVLRANEPRYQLSELIQDDPYTVLVFVGIYPDHDEQFQSDFVMFKKTIPDTFNRYLITNQYDIASYDEDDDVLGDFDAEVHHQLDMPLSMIYIVDQERRVVARSDRAHREQLVAVMEELVQTVGI